MYYIKSTPTENGNYGAPTSRGEIALPDGLLPTYIEAKGFAVPIIDGNAVTSMTMNQPALDAYHAEHPEPTPVPAPDNPEADAMEALLDHEVRVIQLELGTNTTK